MIQEKIENATSLPELKETLKNDGIIVTDKSGFIWEAIYYIVLIVTLGRNKKFRAFYTTIGPVIAVPKKEGKLSKLEKTVIYHESVHVQQFKRMGLGNAWVGIIPMGLLYLLFPVPVGFAWFRWVLEREAYLKDMLFKEKLGIAPQVSLPAKALTSSEYGWALIPWLQGYAQKWFEKQLNKAKRAGK